DLRLTCRAPRHSMGGGIFRERVSQRLGAALERPPLFVRQVRTEHFAYALAADNARQRQRRAVSGYVRSDREHRPLVPGDDLREARADDADAVLAGPDALYDRDVGVAHLPLDVAPELVEPDAPVRDNLLDASAADLRRGPHEHARRAVLADDVRIDRCRGDA